MASIDGHPVRPPPSRKPSAKAFLSTLAEEGREGGASHSPPAPAASLAPAEEAAERQTSASSFLSSLAPTSEQGRSSLTPISSKSVTLDESTADILSSLARHASEGDEGAGHTSGLSNKASRQPSASSFLSSLGPRKDKSGEDASGMLGSDKGCAPAAPAAKPTAATFLQTLAPAAQAEDAPVPACAHGRGMASSFLGTFAEEKQAEKTPEESATNADGSSAAAFLQSLAPSNATAMPTSQSAAQNFLETLGPAASEEVCGAPSGVESFLASLNATTVSARAQEAPDESSVEGAVGHEDDPSAPSMGIGLHMLRFSAYQLSLFRSAGITSLHVVAEAAGVPAQLTTAEVEVGIEYAATAVKGALSSVVIELPLSWPSNDAQVPNRDECWLTRDTHGVPQPLAFVLVAKGSRVAKALRSALSSRDPHAATIRFSVVATFAEDEYEEEEEEVATIASAEVGLRQLLSSRRELVKAPVGLFDDQKREVGSLVVSVHALKACDAVGGPQLSENRLPPAAPDEAQHTEAARASVAWEGAGASVDVDTLLSRRAGCDVDAQSSEAAPAEAAPVELSRDRLPVRVEMSFAELVLAPRWVSDPAIQRVWLEVDILGISDSALRTRRVLKPGNSAQIGLNMTQSLPIYNPIAAARCLMCKGSRKEAATTAAATVVADGKTPLGDKVLASGAEPMSQIRLLGMGRTGVIAMGSARMPLCALLTPGNSEEWIALWPTSTYQTSSQAPGASSVHAAKMEQAAVDTIEPPCQLKIACRLEAPRGSPTTPHRPPPPLGAADAQICVEMHSLRLKLPSATRHLGLATTDPFSGSRAAVHTIWLSFRFPGMASPIESARVRLADVLPSDGVPPREKSHGANEVLAEPGWSRRAVLDSVEAIGLNGQDSQVFVTMRDAITCGGRNADKPLSIELLLLGLGRRGQRTLGTVSLDFIERIIARTDLVRSHLLIRAPQLASSSRALADETYSAGGEPIAEVELSLAMLRAVAAMRESAVPISRIGIGASGRLVGSSAAAPMVVCVGEAALRMDTLRQLRITRVWVEVDLRRGFGVLLRSPSVRPTGPIDFRLRELLEVADGSSQQHALGALLLARGTTADVTVTVFGLSIQADASPSDAFGSPLPPPLVIGRTVVNLAEMLSSGIEPGYEPRVLVDDHGQRQGMICVQLAAHEVLLRAARLAQRETSAPAISIYVDSVEIDPPARQALRAAASGALDAVWVEVALHAAEHVSTPLVSRRVPLRARPAPPGGAASYGASNDIRLVVDLRDRLFLPAGSAIRSAVARSLAHGGDAELHFVLVGSSVAADVAAIASLGESVGGTLASAANATRLALARLSLSELLDLPPQEARLNTQISLLGRNAAALGVLNVSIGGRDTLNALQRTSPPPLGDAVSLREAMIHAACRADVSEINRCLAEGADVRVADEWGQTPLHWAAASGERPAVELILRAGASVNTPNRAGITPLHWAAAWGHVHVVKLLLDAGADKGARDVSGATPATRVLSLNRAPPQGALVGLAKLLGEKDAAASFIQRRIRRREMSKPLTARGDDAHACSSRNPISAVSRRRRASGATRQSQTLKASVVNSGTTHSRCAQVAATGVAVAAQTTRRRRA